MSFQDFLLTKAINIDAVIILIDTIIIIMLLTLLIAIQTKNTYIFTNQGRRETISASTWLIDDYILVELSMCKN